MFKRHSAWLLGLVIGGIVLASSLGSPAAAQALLPGTSVHGTVTDAVTHLPIANAVLYGGPSGMGESEQLAMTDVTGHYEVALPAGSYDISCYVSTQYSEGTALNVVADVAHPAILDFALTPYPRAFYGTVKDAQADEPLASSSVFAESTDLGSHFSVLVHSNELGYYEVYAPAGTYSLTFGATGYSDVATQGVDFSGTTAILKDCSLQPLGEAVFGTVSDGTTSRPIAGASVVLSWSESGSTQESWTSTDLEGSYHFRVPAGAYQVRAAAWPYISSPTADIAYDGDNPVRRDFALQPRAQAEGIAGRVTDALTGGPLPAQVHVSGTTTGGSFEATVSTDDSGHYEIAVPTGTYKITASASSHGSADAADVVFDGYTALTQDFALVAYPVACSGSVVDSSTSFPVPNADVHVFGTDAAGGAHDDRTITDASGAFGLRLPAGSYRIEASASLYRLSIAQDVEFDGTTTVVRDVKVTAYPTALFGSVVDSGTSQPIALAELEVYRLGTGGAYSFQVSAATDASGVYQLRLAPGTYELRASAPGYADHAVSGLVFGGEVSTRCDLRLDPLVVTPTALSIGASPVAPSKYGAATQISGYLRSESSTGPAMPGRRVEVQVSANGSSGWRDVITLTSSSSGYVSWSNVPVSTTYYRLWFQGGASGLQPSTSVVVKVVPKAYIGAATASRYAKRSYTLYSVLKPRHTAGTSPVLIYRWRYVSGRWKPYGYVKAKAYDYSSYTRAKVKHKFPSTGKWRLRAYHADAGHGASWSNYSYLKVR